jgi:integrase
MARTIKPAALGSRTARARLRRGRQPHWNAIDAKSHLGYVRRPAERAGRWILRRRIRGRYSTQTIGAADDAIEADGVGTLSFDEARTRALELANAPRVAGSATVARALNTYIRDLKARGKSTEVADTATLYIAELADVPVAELTTSQLQDWLAIVAAVPVRADRGKNTPICFDDEAARKRKNSANRIAAVIVAALNLAFRAGHAPSDAAWRRLKKFRGVDQHRTRYLSIGECTRLLNACDSGFRNLVRAALSTGMRYSELCRLEVSDLDLDVGTIHVRRSKSGRARYVALNAEALAFFERIATGRSGGDGLLLRESGQPWARANQKRPMREACRNAKIIPPAGFHILRHTFASHAVMRGAPLAVVSNALGHTTTRMTERYAHLARSYIGDAIRAAAPVFGSEPSNVAPIRARGERR